MPVRPNTVVANPQLSLMRTSSQLTGRKKRPDSRLNPPENSSHLATVGRTALRGGQTKQTFPKARNSIWLGEPTSRQRCRPVPPADGK